MKTKLLLLSAAFGLTSAFAFGQTTVVSDDFNTSQGSTFTTSSTIGTSDWSVSRSGDDWGARIDDGILELTNTASTTSNANGWVFANTSLTSSGDFNSTLSDSNGLVSWSFNMRQIRSNPAGFTGNAYGVAFILGSSSTNINSSGNGYAVVLGNSDTPDPIRLVRFTTGINSVQNEGTGAFITASAPLDDPTNNYMSLQVTYNPENNEWALFGRNDGSSAFSDPLSGSLSSLGTATDSTYTSTALTSMGAYWQGSTAGSQTAFFDNVTVTAIPEPSSILMMALAGLAAFGILRNRKK